MSRERKRRAESGVTIIELMVALVISGFAVAAGLSLAFSMMNGFRDHQRSMAVERAARTATDYIANAVRSSSPGVYSGEIVNLTGVSCATQRPALEVANQTSAADELRVFHAHGGVYTSTTADFVCASGSCAGTIDVVDTTGFAAGDTILVTGDHTTTASNHEREFDIGFALQVDSVGTNQLTLSSSCPVSDDTTFTRGALVIRGRYSVFRVDTTNYADPTLVLDAFTAGGTVTEPLAEGIEDFQVAVLIDADTDGDISAESALANMDEIYGNVAGEAGPSAMGLGALPWRAIRTTIVARSVGEQQTGGISTRPAVEDRAADTAQTPYKRRTLTTIIELRNMEGSP